jgi:uncharacterized protein YndB with AHSA1/START domain
MTDSTKVSTDEAIISRWFDAPIQLVWRAFTDADQLAQWYGPTGVEVDPGSVTVEARPGGRWALTMVTGDGRRMPISSTVTDVDEPRRLVVEEVARGFPGLADGTVIVMTVELTEENGGTRLQLRQGPFPDGGAQHAAGGWTQAMDKLADLLAS